MWYIIARKDESNVLRKSPHLMLLCKAEKHKNQKEENQKNV